MKGAQMKELGLFLLVIALWTSAQILLKWGLIGFAGQKVDVRFFLRALSHWPVLTGTLLSAAGALLWLVVLSRFELSYSNLMVSFMYALLVVAAAVIFKEHISGLRWLGAFLIYDRIANATFADSPLVERDYSFITGLALAWVFGEARETVQTLP